MDEKIKIQVDKSQFDSAVKDMIKAMDMFKKSVSDANDSTDKLGKGLKDQTENVNKAGQSWKSMAAGVFTGTAAYEAVKEVGRQVIEFMKESIKLAAEEEVANSKLFNALGRNTTAYADMLAFKEKMIKTTTFSKKEIEGAINMGLELGRTENQTKKMVLAAEGLSKVTGKDLNTSMMMLSSTFEGTLGRLGRFDGQVKTLTQSQLKNGEAIDLIAAKFGKFATEGIDTASGAIDQLDKSSEKLKISLGEAFLPILKSLSNGFKDVVNYVTGFVEIPLSEKTKEEAVNINQLVGQIINLNQNDKHRGELLDQLMAKYPEYFSFINKDTITNKELLNVLKDVNSTIEHKIELMALDERSIKLEEQRTKATKNSTEAYNKLYEAYKELGGKSLAPTVQEIKTLIDANKNLVVSGFNVGKIAKKIYDDNIEDFNKYNKEYNDLDEQLFKLQDTKQKKLGETANKITADNTKFEKADKSSKERILKDTQKYLKDLQDSYTKELKTAPGTRKTAQLFQDIGEVQKQADDYEKVVEQLNQKTKGDSAKTAEERQKLEKDLADKKLKINQDTEKLILDEEKQRIDKEIELNKISLEQVGRVEELKKLLDERKKLLDDSAEAEKHRAIQTADDSMNIKQLELKNETETINKAVKDNVISRSEGNKQINDLTKLYSSFRIQSENQLNEQILQIDAKNQKDKEKVLEDGQKQELKMIDNQIKAIKDAYKSAPREQIQTEGVGALELYNKVLERKNLIEQDSLKLTEQNLQYQIEYNKISNDSNLTIDQKNAKLAELTNLIDANSKSINGNSKEIKDNTKLVAAEFEKVAAAANNFVSGPMKGTAAAFSKLMADVQAGVKITKEQIIDTVATFASEIGNMITTAMSQDVQRQFDETMKSLDTTYNKELDALNKLHDSKLISDTDYNKKKKALDDKLLKDQNAAKLKEWKAQQQVAITQAIINTAIGVTTALASSPPPYDFILAAIVAAAGAVQIATIESQKPPIFAKGGMVKALGGYLNGPSHSQGGVPINAEGGEFIVRKDVVKKPFNLQLLNNINNNQQTQPTIAMINPEDMNMIVKSIVSNITSIPVTVTESDITKTQRTVSVIEKSASI